MSANFYTIINVSFCLIFGFSACTVSSSPRQNINSYNADVAIDFILQTIRVSSSFEFHKTAETALVDFSLSARYDSIAVSGPDIISHQITEINGKKVITIKCNRGSNLLKIMFTYVGSFENFPPGFSLVDDEILPFQDLGIHYQLFTYRLNILTKKHLFANGKVEKKGSQTLVTSTTPVDRLLILVSDTAFITSPRKLISGCMLDITTIPEFQDSIHHILKKIPEILKFYNSLSCSEPLKSLRIVYNPYINYSFYCRSGVINLHPVQSQRAALYFLSHEIAHYWWSKAAVRNRVPDAFLNESFAEFYAYLFYRNFYGKEKYDELWIRKSKEMESIKESIGDISASMEDSIKGPVLYTKGALLLCDLEKYAGEEAFKRFLCEIQKRKISDLKAFERVLKEVLGRDAWDFFYKRFV